MSLDYIRTAYNVPAQHGTRVRYTGGKAAADGTIVGAQGAHLLIQLDHQDTAFPYHPTWKIEYLADAPLLLEQWVVTASPSDFPGQFVARKWLIGAGLTAVTDMFETADDLAQLRSRLPFGLTCIGRQPGDDPVIVEVWL